ncbi:hypothetical protein V1525DRAFT_409036 [Lipomyces kononenkoae]|uniref:Uncharacterized protein n=1 Tax=Lipomyces kononenkoae TaxID=34357 RepID=A0ACC3SW11_LIPKO
MEIAMWKHGNLRVYHTTSFWNSSLKVQFTLHNQSHTLDETRSSEEEKDIFAQGYRSANQDHIHLANPNLNSARSWSESLAKLEALRNPKLSDSEVKNLDAIKNYFEERLKGLVNGAAFITERLSVFISEGKIPGQTCTKLGNALSTYRATSGC